MPNFEISYSFVRGDHWHQQKQKAQQLFQDLKDKSFLVLGLGIGYRNQLIKAPLMALVAQSPQASYITINKGEIYIPNEIRERSIGVDGNLAEVLNDLVEVQKK